MVLLSFDIEEFDMPMEYGKQISFDDQVNISFEGTYYILGLLERYDIKATFFCTANFARKAPDLINEIVSMGHEVASHGYYHSQFHDADLRTSKLVLEEITGKPVKGFRMARMMPVDEKQIRLAGYQYNSSINPTWIPGRYNNLDQPRTMFHYESILQVPASVSPLLRLPLFWLSFHNFPLWLYKMLCKRTYNKDRYLNLYFHPWEFTNLKKSKLGLPGFVKRNSGRKMISRMDSLIRYLKANNLEFSTIDNFVSNKIYNSPVAN